MKYNSYLKDLVKKFNKSSSKDQSRNHMATSKNKPRLITE